MKEEPFARSFLVRVIRELDNARLTIDKLWPPRSETEAIIVGMAILESGSREEIAAFLSLKLVAESPDASVREVRERINERRQR